jgi:hypothetical protein
MLTRQEIDATLKALELEMPLLLRDRNTFFEAFEDRTELLLADVAPEDETYALDRLKEMVDRAGVNGG